MRAFIWVMLILYSLRAILTLNHLASGKYPRQEKPIEAGFDVTALVINIYFIAWAAYLILQWSR